MGNLTFNILDIIDILAIVLALMIAIIGHEIMHGRMAYYYGDDTAKKAGRFSINPIKHIDPVGTIIVPLLLYLSHAGFLFGWAKPVPVNMRTVLNNAGEKGAIQVSLAGIYFNFFMALISVVLLKSLTLYKSSLFDIFLAKFLFYSLIYNVVLGVFNLFPIPPLDGANALTYTLTKFGFHKIAYKFQELSKYGMIILIILIATPLGNIIFYPINLAIKFFLSI